MLLTKSRKIIVSLIITSLIVAFMFLATACGGSNVVSVSTYEELVEAINGKSEIVQLENDIFIEDTIAVSRKVVLDMNGKTLSTEKNIWNVETNSWSIVSVRANGELTIRGNGVILAKEDDSYGIDVMDGGKLLIENGEIIGNISAVYVYEGSAEILGGKYSIQQLDPVKDYQFTLNLLDENREQGTASIVVSGGSFENFDPSNNTAEGDNISFLKDGYIATLDSEAEIPTYVVTEA